MCNEFQQVFQLCNFIMTNSQNTNLINVTLETLLRFLNWIPLGYIFETELIPHLIETFLVMPAFRNVTLKCLTEIVSINVGTYQDKFVILFNMAMTRLKQVSPVNLILLLVTDVAVCGCGCHFVVPGTWIYFLCFAAF